MTVLWALIGLTIGISVGVGVVWQLTRARLRKARASADQTRHSALEESRSLAISAALQTKERQAELEEEAEHDLTLERADLDDYTTEVDAREAVLTSREADVEELQTDVDAKEESVRLSNEDVKRRASEIEASRDLLVAQLEERAEITSDEALEQLVRDRSDKARHQAQMRLRQLEEEQIAEATTDSARVMAIAIDRYAGISHLERIQNAIAIPEARTLEAFVDDDGPARMAFSQEIGCELLCDVEAGTATVRGDDPLAREVARRVLRQIANRSIHAPDRIRNIAKQVKGEVDREVQNAGRKAIRMLGLERVHPDIMHLVGRLKYRLSYSQNQLKHSIEVAYISGMIADELGLSVADARRGGLLHDIGKAMTHDHEGSHAVLGAEVARKCGETEIISNAIGSHHNDEQPLGPIARIVAAADAISGARPGARRESVTNYVRRIQEIQEIASRSPAVRRVDVMHAGREVRVIVAGVEQGSIDESEKSGGILLTDDELQPLALDIVRDLEEELTFAGQIRVTVIRESRAVSIAV